MKLKHKLAHHLLVFVIIMTVCIMAFAACDEADTPNDTDTPPVHQHTIVIDDAISATCTSTGLTAGAHCSVCNEVLVMQEIIPVNDHIEAIDLAKSPTCVDEGATEGKHCSACNEVLVAQETIPANNHIEEIDKSQAPTCTETGLTEGKHCSVCNLVLVYQQTISATEHIYDDEYDNTCNVCNHMRDTECSHVNTVSQILADRTYLKKYLGKNLFNKKAITVGYYLAYDELCANNNYAVSDYIPVEPSTVYAITGLVGGGANHCFYDADKNYIGYIDDTELVNTYNSILTVPEGAYWVRLSINVNNVSVFQIEEGTVPTTYEEYTEYVPLQELEKELEKELELLRSHLSDTTKNPVLTIGAETINDGDYLVLSNNIDVKKNHTQTFFAKTSNFSSIQIGHGETEFGAYYTIIDRTHIRVYDGFNSTLEKEVSHGLTIADYIYVVINKKNESVVDIIVTTSTGSYILSSVSWDGDNGAIYAKNIGSTLTDCTLNWTSSDLQYDIWVFGDSYLGLTSAARFPSYLLQYGYKNWLACGFPGAPSASAYAAFAKLLELGTPKYAVWCLGMNDPDNGSINASYLANTQAFIKKCEENGIIPIISTIPSCWGSTSEDSDITLTRDNSYKNAWVKASGYRYIDFADAVENPDGSGWYSGMLYTDGVHPTVLGAVTLANRFIRDFPEICTTA